MTSSTLASFKRSRRRRRRRQNEMISSRRGQRGGGGSTASSHEALARDRRPHPPPSLFATSLTVDGVGSSPVRRRPRRAHTGASVQAEATTAAENYSTRLRRRAVGRSVGRSVLAGTHPSWRRTASPAYTTGRQQTSSHRVQQRTPRHLHWTTHTHTRPADNRRRKPASRVGRHFSHQTTARTQFLMATRSLAARCRALFLSRRLSSSFQLYP